MCIAKAFKSSPVNIITWTQVFNCQSLPIILFFQCLGTWAANECLLSITPTCLKTCYTIYDYGLCSHQMTRICLQPVMLVLSLLGDYGNKCNCRLTSRICVILPLCLGLNILVTITSQANLFSFCMLSYYLNLIALLQYFLPISEKNTTHLKNPSSMPAFITIFTKLPCHVVLCMSALRWFNE